MRRTALSAMAGRGIFVKLPDNTAYAGGIVHILGYWCAALPLHAICVILSLIRRGRRGDFDDADIWALGQESLGLLDALIERRISGS